MLSVAYADGTNARSWEAVSGAELRTMERLAKRANDDIW